MGSLGKAVRQVGIALAAALLWANAAAGTDCQSPDSRGIQKCRAGLEPAQVLAMQATQEKSQWCWAATIAMVFAHHGHALPQQEVVRHHFADLADRGVSGATITQMLSQFRVALSGRMVVADVTVADAHAKRFDLPMTSVIEELNRGRPLILGAQEHAVVLVELEYERFIFQDAIRVTGGTVVDPAPGRGVRRLLPPELRPSYLAAIRLGPESQQVAVE